MQMKTPKFLICENPLGKEPGRIFILHNREPFILAEAFHFDESQNEEWMRCKSAFTIGASVDYPGELIALGAVWTFGNTLSAMSAQEQADTLAGVMRRMGDWYHAYLKFEDENIANNTTADY